MRVFRVAYLGAFVWLLSLNLTALASSPIRQLTTSDAVNVRPVWNHDATRIAFQSDRDGPFHIFVMDADGGNLKRISSGAVDDRHPAWSPDGTAIAVDSGDATQREIWVIDVSSGARTQVTRTGAVASFPSWSPDGKRIAYFLYREGATDLWTTARDGAAPTRMTQQLASEQNSQCTFACHAARWSPDGTQLALSDGNLTHVLLMPAAGGAAARPISPDGERSHFPVYLADGTIIYVSEHLSLDQSWTDLWAVDPSRTGQRTQVAQGVLAQGPFEISSDGQQLLFASPRSGNFEIYAVTLDPAGKSALATSPSGAVSAPAASAAPAAAAPGLSPEAWALVALGLIVGAAEVARRVLRRMTR